jgi:tripartite-type tricarboxylate transporter receptor subunit TctC
MNQTTVKLNWGKRFLGGWSTCKTGFFLTIFILGFLGLSQQVRAQEYPTKPITMLISFAPGAGTDVCSRTMAEEAKKILGQEIIPVNKPGGGSAVAMGILASSKGDGYTICAATAGALTHTPHFESVPYDPLKDFVPIIQFAILRQAMVVRSDSPFKSFKDLVDYARKEGKVTCGVPSLTGSSGLNVRQVMQKEDINIVMVAFRGATPTMTALLGGHVQLGMVSESGFVRYLKAGQVRTLLSFASKRIEIAPETPTADELGIHIPGWGETMYVMLAPKGTPPAVVKKLEEAFRKAMDTPEYRKVTKNFHNYVEDPLSGQKLKEEIEEQYNRNRGIIQKLKSGN